MTGMRRMRCVTLAALVFALLRGGEVAAQKVAAQKTVPSYTVTDLGGLSGLSYKGSLARAINDSGQIAGGSTTAGPNGAESHPVVWAEDASGKYVITDLNPVPGTSGNATGINNQGEVVASQILVRPATVNGSLVWYLDLNADGVNDLLTRIYLDPFTISDNTQIAAGPNLAQFDAMGNEVITTLPNNGIGYAINDNRQVAGQVIQATIWQVDSAGNVLGAVTLAPLAGNTNGTANCIDPLGRAAGYSYYASGIGILPRATLWQNGTVPTDLGTLGGQSAGSQAIGINTVNGTIQVVGRSTTHSGERPFVWKNGVMTDLNKLISASGVSLIEATGINANGQIVANGYLALSSTNSEYHAFLLTPK